MEISSEEVYQMRFSEAFLEASHIDQAPVKHSHNQAQLKIAAHKAQN